MRRSVLGLVLFWVSPLWAGSGTPVPAPVSSFMRPLLRVADVNQLRPLLDLGVINVKDAPWLVRGDGVTDDTAAINSAIAAAPSGASVYFPPGTYRVSRRAGSYMAVQVLQDHVTLSGAGTSSVIYCPDGNDTALSVCSSATGESAATWIEGVTIHSLKVLGAEDTVLTDPGTIQIRGNGIRLGHARKCRIYDVEVEDMCTIGIANVNGGHELLIENCIVVNSGYTNININGISTAGCQIINCTSRTTYGGSANNVGIQVSGSTAVIGCFVYDSYGPGILQGEGGNLSVIQGNTVIANRYGGIRIVGNSSGLPTYNSFGCTVSGNILVANSGGNGITVDPNTWGTAIVGNTLIDNYPYDVSVGSPSVVMGNSFKYVADFEDVDGTVLPLEDLPVVYPTPAQPEAAIYVAIIGARSTIVGNQAYGQLRGLQSLTRDLRVVGNDFYLHALGPYVVEGVAYTDGEELRMPVGILNGSASAGYVRIYEDSDDGTNYVEIQGGALAANSTLTFADAGMTYSGPIVGTFLQGGVTAGVTATNPGVQGDNPITKQITEVSTVGAGSDAVTAPAAVAGREFTVINNGANTLEIWPASGDNLGAGVDTAVTLASGNQITYAAYNTTNWEQLGSGAASGASFTFTGVDATPDAAGELQYDPTVAGLTTGALVWWDGDEARYLVDLDTLPANDDWVVSWDQGTGRFVMKQDADSGGATAWDSLGDPAGDGSVAFGGTEQTITSTLDEASHAVLTISHTAAEVTAETALFKIQSVDDDDPDLIYFAVVDGVGTTNDTVFSIRTDGAVAMDGGLTSLGTVEGATLTEGGKAVYNDDEMDSSSELATILQDETGTAGAVVFSDSPTFTDDITVAAAGVLLTGANGSLTILGKGDGADEDIKLDLNTTANTLTITSPASSLDKIDATGITITAAGFAGPLTGAVTGNADTASTAAVATTVTITDNENTAENNPLVFVAGGDLDGGDLGLETDGTAYYTPSTGIITATGFAGGLTGNVAGDASGSSGSCTGNAATATTATNEVVNDATSGTYYVAFYASDTGASLPVYTDGALSYAQATGTLASTVFSGAFTGNLTGNADTVTTNANLSGDVTSAGNATTIAADAVHTGMINDGEITVGDLATATKTFGINFIIDGGGSEITAGIKGDIEMPFAATITSVRLLADQSGSIVVDIWEDTYASFPPTDADSSTAAAPPTIAGAVKSEDQTLTDWDVTLAAGDILRFNVDSCTTITKCTLSIRGTKL